MYRRLLLAAGLACLLGVTAQAEDQPRLPKPDSTLGFSGKINIPSSEESRAQLLLWAKTKNAEAPVNEAWQKSAQRPVLDRTVEIIGTADAEIASVLKLVAGSPKTDVVDHPYFKNTTFTPFVKNNVSLYLARILASKKMYEEALAILRTVNVEKVVDPAAYYFYKAACENKLRMKEEGLASVHRLLNSVPNAPERYIAIASVMQDEMAKWEDADLSDIARRMEEIEGRLENAKAGPSTRGKQKEVITLLDKMIEDLEKQC